MAESTDSEQAAFAATQQRAIVTHNKRDFVLIHRSYIEKGKEHWGIIAADQNKIGPLIRMISKLWFTLSTEEMKNRLEFLSRWR
jgi:hypothetical protein